MNMWFLPIGIFIGWFFFDSPAIGVAIGFMMSIAAAQRNRSRNDDTTKLD